MSNDAPHTPNISAYICVSTSYTNINIKHIVYIILCDALRRLVPNPGVCVARVALAVVWKEFCVFFVVVFFLLLLRTVIIIILYDCCLCVVR